MDVRMLSIWTTFMSALSSRRESTSRPNKDGILTVRQKDSSQQSGAVFESRMDHRGIAGKGTSNQSDGDVEPSAEESGERS